MRKTLLPLLFVLMLASVALAQSTPFTTEVFSATFVGPVKTREIPTKGNTSTNFMYEATASGVNQVVALRTLNAPGIRVNRESLDVYGDDVLVGGKVQDERQYYTVQEHIAVYVNAHYTDEAGFLTRRRALIIITSQRTVMMVLQEAPDSKDNGAAADWRALWDSLTLLKACWLPEGCK